MHSIVELSGADYLEMFALHRLHEELSLQHGIVAAFVDFSGVDLSGVDLGGVDLGGVDLSGVDGSPRRLADHSAEFATVPCIIVATNCAPASTTTDLCDVALDDDEVVRFGADLRSSITSNPLAATALAVHLRGADTRTVHQGLVAESVTYSLLQSGPEFARWLTGRGNPFGGSAPTDEAVVVDRTGDRLVIELNRPERHNAFSRDMRDAFVSALSIALMDEEVTQIDVSGRGRSFCSGGDLAEFGTFASPIASHLTRLTRSPAWLLAQLADHTTVHLHGACYGAGIELAAFVKDVAASSNARICLPEIGLGLIPGAGGTASIPRRIGRHRTALLGLSGSEIDASTALAWGLIDRIED